MVKRRAFTDPFIRALKPKAKPYKLSEHAAKGDGRLIVRVLPSGTKEFFYRYQNAGQDKMLFLGRYDHTGRNGKTLATIRKGLRESRAIQRETGDAKGHQQAEDRKLDAEKRRGSLAQLCAAYVEALKAAGKPSSAEAGLILRRHVLKPFPMLAAAKANTLEPGDIQRILARMVSAGLTRQVNKTRSYLGAAFEFGGKADHDPRTVAAGGVMFALKANPVKLVPVIREYERTGERVLSEDELREYWRGLAGLPIAQGATLRFNLALACQRPTQLLRAAWDAFDFSEATLLLKDSKGRGGARDHLLPLTAFALEQIEPLREMNKDGPPFAGRMSESQTTVETLSDAVRGIAKRLKREKRIPRFGLRDLRRTAETMLQKLGIDREVRAHLLSHGRTKGVQGKHYERYDFLPEKRAALEKWARHVERITTGKAATVTPIRAA